MKKIQKLLSGMLALLLILGAMPWGAANAEETGPKPTGTETEETAAMEQTESAGGETVSFQTEAEPAAAGTESGRTVPDWLPAYPVEGGYIYYTVQKDAGGVGSVVIAGCDETVTVVNIPDRIDDLPVRSIVGGFDYRTHLTSISIPESVISIETQFLGCSSLAEIRVAEGNPAYCNDEYGVLYNKEKTELIQVPGGFRGDYVIPEGVKTVGRYAFTECSGLSGVTIPGSVTVIEYDAFSNCDNLTSVCIREGVASIGARAFACCNGLTSVTIPKSVTFIGTAAFSWCYCLEEIRVDKENPAYCNDEKGVLFNKDRSVLIWAPANLQGSYAIPDGVASIGDCAFGVQKGLTDITIPESVSTIGESAFYGCRLASITIPKSVMSIGEAAFSCRSLRFLGNKPEMGENESNQILSEAVTATIYYPAGDDTWTEFIQAGRPGCEEHVWIPWGGYEIIEGANGKWEESTAEPLEFRADGMLEDFTGVYVDGALVSPEHYDLRSGSTIVSLHADYLTALSEGVHALRMVFTDGSAETTFIVLPKSVAPVPTDPEPTDPEPTDPASTDPEPSAPSAPDESKPTEPSTPDASHPTDPAKPAEPDLPKTGDETNLLMMGGILSAALLGIMALALLMLRKDSAGKYRR